MSKCDFVEYGHSDGEVRIGRLEMSRKEGTESRLVNV
jgi:hypothetical protein